MYCTMQPSHATRHYRIPTGPPSDAACAPGESGVRWKSAACGFAKSAFTKIGLPISEWTSFPSFFCHFSNSLNFRLYFALKIRNSMPSGLSCHQRLWSQSMTFRRSAWCRINASMALQKTLSRMTIVALAPSSGRRTDVRNACFGRPHALLSPYLVPQSIRQCKNSRQTM